MRDAMSNNNALSNCEATRQLLLDVAPDAAERRAIAAAMAHLDGCELCAQAMRQFDQVRSTLTADASADPAGGWEAFEARLQSSLEHQASPRPILFRLLRPAGAIAAGVMLAVAGFLWGAQRARPPVAKTRDVEPATLAALSKADVTRQLRAFGEIDQVFEGRTRWLLLTNAGADVGLDENSAAAGATRPSEEKVMLLRLSVSRGDEIVSTADLVIVPGKTAELRLPTRDGGIVRYRLATSGIDPSKLALRAEMRTGAGAEPQASLGTDLLLRPDRGTDAGALITPKGKYDVKVSFAAATL
jgi:hypothetical protein